MILIVGSSRDDVLYFNNVMRNKSEGVILNKFPISIGTIFNQNVIVVHEVYTSLVASMVTSYIINHYDIILAINGGRCSGFTQTLKTGDIAISRCMVALDSDQTSYLPDVRVGQIPTFDQKVDFSEKIKPTLKTALEKLSLGRQLDCYYMSSDTVYTNRDQLAQYTNEGVLLGIDGNIVFDCESIGIGVVCGTYDIPFIAVKVVQNIIGKKTGIDDYIAVIKRYASLGKAVISFIGEVGRSDMLEFF